MAYIEDAILRVFNALGNQFKFFTESAANSYIFYCTLKLQALFVAFVLRRMIDALTTCGACEQNNVTRLQRHDI
jgi:hypothetical protein